MNYPCLRKVCTVVPDGDDIVLYLTNSNSISNLQNIPFVITTCLTNLSGEVKMVINGKEIDVHNKYGVEAEIGQFECRKCYNAYYVEDEDYVIVTNAPSPHCEC